MRHAFFSVAVIFFTSLAYAQKEFITPTQITNTSIEERSPAISPDGKLLAYLSNEKFGDPYQLRVLDLSSGESRFTSEKLSLQDGIVWRDSHTILAGDLTTFGGRIIEIDLAKGSLATLYEAKSKVAFVAKGVGFETLLFSRLNAASQQLPDEPNFSIWQLDLETGKARELFDSPARDLQPMAMRDGRISFFSRMDTMGASDELYALDLMSNKVERLLENPGDDFSPAPSPDGRWIAFANNASSVPALFLFGLDTGQVRPISALEKRLSQPAWSADSRQLYFVARSAGSPADIYRIVFSS